MPMSVASVRTLAASAAFALVGVAGVAFAQQAAPGADAAPPPAQTGMPGHGPRGGPGAPGPMGFGGPREMRQLLDSVNATDAQRTQIRDLMRGAEPAMRAERQTVEGLRAEQLKLLTQPTLDPAAAEAVRQKMLTQQDQASKRQLALMLDVSRVLTPDQRAKVATQMAQEHRRPGRGEPPPAQPLPKPAS